MIVRLPYPAKVLWPNGPSGNRHAKSRAAKDHKAWAWAATKEVAPPCFASNGATIPIHLVVFPKATGPHPDRDNCVASIKHYLDGIADALGVNDRTFSEPTVEFGPREGRFEIHIGGQRP